VSLNIYLRLTLGSGGQIRFQKPATAYMLALAVIFPVTGTNRTTMKKRINLLTILSISLLTAFGQTKTLTGTYTNNRTTHKITIIIRDNGQFESDELMTEGKRALIGTWTFKDDTITLKTNKILAWDKKTKEKKEYAPNNFPDSFIYVDKNKQLTLLAPKDTELLDTRLQKLK
jgi:hypothetical protein